MDKWEYKVETQYFGRQEGLNDYLNKQGQEGWELISIPEYGETIALNFKRKVLET